MGILAFWGFIIFLQLSGEMDFKWPHYVAFAILSLFELYRQKNWENWINGRWK